MHPDIRQYAEWGYHLVPWLNRSDSSPRPLIKGWQTVKPSIESVEDFASRWPLADWAIVPKGAIVLDLENKNGKDGMLDLDGLCQAHGISSTDDLIGNCPVSSTPSGGFHVWFRLPEGSSLVGGFYLRDGIEIKGGNGSAHVPPSMARSWIRPLVPLADIPEAPGWLMAELFAAKKEKREATPFKAAKIANGHRRDFLLSCAGKMRQDFAMGESELKAALIAIRNARCEDPETMTDDEVGSIAADYAGKECTDTFALAIAGDPIAQCAISFFGKQIQVAPPEPEKPVAGDGLTLDDDFCRPTKMIATWLDWYRQKCVMEQPELALLSIITSISALVGRDYTWHDSQANLYSICLGGTGVGKEAVKRVCEEVIEQSGLGFMLGTGTFASDAGMFRELAANPEILWINDEFQVFVSQLALMNAPTYVKSIERIVTEGYTGKISGRSLKIEQHDNIKDPYPVILALSQPETFWKAMTPRMVESGFLGRFLILSARPLKMTGDGGARSRLLPPDELIDLIKPGIAGRTIVAARSGVAAQRKQMRSTDEADDLLMKLRRDEKSRRASMDEASFGAKMAARSLEKAIRVAMCYAWSENPVDPCVTEEGLEWAVKFVRYCDERMTESMEANTACNPYEQALKQIKAMIAASGTSGMTKSILVSKTSHVSGTARDDMIKSLLTSDFIAECKRPSKRGPPTTFYIMKEYANECQS